MTSAYFIPAGTTVTLPDGSVLVGREWGAEQEAVVMAVLAKHKGGCATSVLAAALGRGQPETRHYLGQLADQGKLENIGHAATRALWVRLDTSVDQGLVVETHKPKIRAFLLGRREMAGKIAAELRLPKEEVVETCKAMMLAGELIGTRVGMAFIYALDQRHQERYIAPEKLVALPISEGQRFQRELEVLRARSPEPTYQKSNYRPKHPPAPADWVALRDLGKELRWKPDIIKSALTERGIPVETMYRVGVRGTLLFTSPEGAQAMRELRTTQAAAPSANHLSLEKTAKKVKLPARQVRGLVNRGRIKHEGKGKDAIIDVRDLEAYKPRLQRVTAAHKKHAKKAMKNVLGSELTGDLNVSQAARFIGANPMALHKWLELHEEARKLCYRKGKYLMVPPKVLEMYGAASLPVGATFATTVPDDWLTIWQAVDFVGWSYTKLYKMLAAGQIEGVLCSGTVRFNPETLRQLKATLDDQSAVPEGWIAVQELCKELEVLDKTSAVSWMARNNFEVRKYRDHQRQLASFISPEGAEAYRAFRSRTPGGLKITPQIEAELRALAECAPRRGKRFAFGAMLPVAEHYGITTSSINIVLRRPASPEVQACEVNVLGLVERFWPKVPNSGLVLVQTLPSPDASTQNLPGQAVSKRPVMTLALEEKIREELPPSERRKAGRTQAIAEKYGLSVGQVRSALARVPVRTEPAQAPDPDGEQPAPPHAQASGY